MEKKLKIKFEFEYDYLFNGIKLCKTDWVDLPNDAVRVIQTFGDVIHAYVVPFRYENGRKSRNGFKFSIKLIGNKFKLLRRVTVKSKYYLGGIHITKIYVSKGMRDLNIVKLLTSYRELGNAQIVVV